MGRGIDPALSFVCMHMQLAMHGEQGASGVRIGGEREAAEEEEGMAKGDRIGTLNVAGIGEVQVRPDVATVRLAIVTDAKSAAEAVEQNAQRINNVVGQVNALEGITRDDIRTIGLTVFPVTRYDEETEQTVIEGYRAVNAIAVTVPVEMAGQVFDTGITAGASESSGITFGLRDERPYRMTALDEAVGAARAEAERVAESVGVRLLEPRNIDVEQGAGPMFRGLQMARVGGAETPVYPGQITIMARVQITYAFERRGGRW